MPVAKAKKVDENRKFRVRRKADGMFFGSRTWGVSHSKTGKFYNTGPQAVAAFNAGQLSEHESRGHELVEYEVREVGATDLE